MDIKPGDLVAYTGPAIEWHGTHGRVERFDGNMSFVTITKASPHCALNGYGIGRTNVGLRTKELTIIKNNYKSMNLTQKMALVFKGEPEKSFIKAGVMNADETLTVEGQALFMSWMLKEQGDEFKKDVIDVILEEMESDK